MSQPFEDVLSAFRRTAERVPAYRALLSEAGVRPDSIRNLDDFRSLPVTEKRNTFQRFPIEELCLDGRLGRLGAVLTSSGHSGVFAFGLTEADAMPATTQWIDTLLDMLFRVRSRPTLLINCLPMGVKVPTEACTLAETSVRPDMAVALVAAFGKHYEQVVLVGEAAFVKHVLELGRSRGVAWGRHRVHVIVGEEPLAENARGYLEGLLEIDSAEADAPLVISSMGVAELGLNLFFEAPPHRAIVQLRRALHRSKELRSAVLGGGDWVPCLFTYDPQRIYVEFDAEESLLVSTLSPWTRVPLIRYRTGDCGAFVRIPATVEPALADAGVPVEQLRGLPLVTISGRGHHVRAGDAAVFPEAVKEALYHSAALAERTTANFRLASGPERARVRIQLVPGVEPNDELNRAFAAEIARYVAAPVDVRTEPYAAFGDGMALDYERKFTYLEDR
ncbi:hypothetical protein DB347_06160 [Opitutaceae bacterium EW11]|nr:hypothetical protein DB347_06160 [Opitutaceae bacterium EW11]